MQIKREVLQLQLLEAEAALHQLMIGKSAISISRSDSAGNSRAYQYSQANIDQLRAYIVDLRGQLGAGGGRLRPAGVRT
ncbi:gpW family head-tail joining protein [Enterobacter hormaechei]|uniref:gpW family head-tail joining protein n=1 Tax=Enterobacter hormaechei TaxID=158836 RepID=UPI002A755777|nr:gpW family head-tail joining protein [Enterobacter hormaechei]MDY3572322.1 gpW family head-tail joining protein [Enterobacter hormaechei]